MEQAVDGVKGQLSSIPKDNLCALCITKTLGKSGKGGMYVKAAVLLILCF